MKYEGDVKQLISQLSDVSFSVLFESLFDFTDIRLNIGN